MDYDKLMHKTFEEWDKGNGDLANYVNWINVAQNKIINIINEDKLLYRAYWHGVAVGGNSEVEFFEDGTTKYVEIKKLGSPTEFQTIVERKINDSLYGVEASQNKIDFAERMINEERPFEDSNNIWEGFKKGSVYDFNADVNQECYNNLVPYLEQHFEKLDNYIEKWDTYKEMFNRIELGEKPVSRDSFDYVPGDREKVKKSLIEKILGK